MHDAGVVGDNEVTVGEERGNFVDRAESGGVDHAAGVAGDELLDEKTLEGLAGKGDQEIGRIEAKAIG